jgi:hypothetical protein
MLMITLTDYEHVDCLSHIVLAGIIKMTSKSEPQKPTMYSGLTCCKGYQYRNNDDS